MKWVLILNFASTGSLLKKCQVGFDLSRNRVDLQWLVIVLIEIADNRKTVPNTPLIAKITDYIYSLK
jgi:hypothetical protein